MQLKGDMTRDWREGPPGWRDVLLIVGVYTGVLFGTGLLTSSLPSGQGEWLLWVAPALANLAVGYVWGRVGERGRLTTIAGMVSASEVLRRVKPLALGMAAAAGMLAMLFVGYGVGWLVQKRGGPCEET